MEPKWTQSILGWAINLLNWQLKAPCVPTFVAVTLQAERQIGDGFAGQEQVNPTGQHSLSAFDN
jgi:hypothetical protein